MKWMNVKKLRNSYSIAQVENEFGRKLPQDYKDLILHHNNGYPEPNTFDTKHKKGKAFGELLNFNLDEKGNILEHYSWIKNKLPIHVYPITVTPGGDYLCLDYRENSNDPFIVYWDHEQMYGGILSEDQKYSLDFVSGTMRELLHQLYENDTDETDTSGFVTIWEDFLDEDELKELSDSDLEAVNYRRAKEGLAPIEK